MLTPENIGEFVVNVYSGPSHGTALDNMAAYKPKRGVIAIGGSATAWMDPEYFAYLYADFIGRMKAASPDTQIIIQAILPVDKRYDTGGDSFTNKKINNTNYYIGQMCEEIGVKFLDPTSVMKDANGQAAQGYTYENDGIHPTEAAYERIIHYIRTHTYPEN
jgi:lysophospholipase L1-like esterase